MDGNGENGTLAVPGCCHASYTRVYAACGARSQQHLSLSRVKPNVTFHNIIKVLVYLWTRRDESLAEVSAFHILIFYSKVLLFLRLALVLLWHHNNVIGRVLLLERHDFNCRISTNMGMSGWVSDFGELHPWRLFLFSSSDTQKNLWVMLIGPTAALQRARCQWMTSNLPSHSVPQMWLEQKSGPSKGDKMESDAAGTRCWERSGFHWVSADI